MAEESSNNAPQQNPTPTPAATDPSKEPPKPTETHPGAQLEALTEPQAEGTPPPPENHAQEEKHTPHHENKAEHSAPPEKKEKHQEEGRPQLGFMGSIKEVFRTLKSNDTPSRRMAWIFVASLFGLIVALVQGGMVLRQNQLTRQVASHKAEEHQHNEGHDSHSKKSGTSHYQERLVELGSFQIELKETSPDDSPTQVSNLALLDAVLLCDSADTASVIKEKLPKVRNLILNGLISANREDFMSPLGKRKLKINLIKKVNAWLEEGSIEDVYFPKLVLN